MSDRERESADTPIIQVIGEVPASPITDQRTIFDMFGVLWANAILIVLISGATTVAAVAYALLATEIFRSDILMAPAEEVSLQSSLLGQFGGLASIAGVSVGGNGNAESIAVLKSRDFTRAFIVENNLMPILYASKWDAEKEQWKSMNPEKQPHISDAVEKFDRKVRSVQENRTTGLVRLSIEWRDAELAAKWANSLADRLNADMREREMEEASTNIDYLSAELAKANVLTLQQSIGRLLETELQKLMLAKGNDEFAYRIIDRAEVAHRRAKPRRVFITIFGALVGFVSAIMFVLVREAYRSQNSGAA